METATNQTLTLTDIVFEHRNQAYGAYVLRQTYEPTLTRAAGLGVGFFLLALAAPTLYTHLTDRQADRVTLIEVNLQNLKTPPLPESLKRLTIPPAENLPTPKTIRSLPPEVRPDEEVTAPDLPPTVEELADATPSDKTQEGTGDETAIIAPPEEATAPTKTELAVAVAPNEELPFVTVEQQPEFPGGLSALGSYLQKTLRYPPAAVNANTSGRVYVRFVVNTDGSLTDVQVLKGIGFGCDEEAIRVIRQMPRWKPGKQAGRPVRVTFNLPVVFTLE